MTGGFYQMHRGWMKHPILQDGPFTRREAWLWLIENAAFAAHNRLVSGTLFPLQRGQLCHSIRFIADAWDWKKDRVLRFLKTLQRCDMIKLETATEAATGRTVVTICNYDRYQAPLLNDATATATETRQRSARNRDSDATNYKKGNNNNPYTGDFLRFWDAYPSRGGHANPKKPAALLFQAAIRRGTPVDAIVAAAARYSRHADETEIAGTEKVAQAQTWLKQERWADQPGASPRPAISRVRALI